MYRVSASDEDQAAGTLARYYGCLFRHPRPQLLAEQYDEVVESGGPHAIHLAGHFVAFIEARGGKVNDSRVIVTDLRHRTEEAVRGGEDNGLEEHDVRALRLAGSGSVVVLRKINNACCAGGIYPYFTRFDLLAAHFRGGEGRTPPERVARTLDRGERIDPTFLSYRNGTVRWRDDGRERAARFR